MTDDRSYLDLAGCADLLGLRKRDLRRMVRAGRFAAPAGSDAGDPYWEPDTVRAWWAAQGAEQAAQVPVDLWPAAVTPVPFLGADRWPVRGGGPDDVLLRWAPSSGVVGILWRPDRTAYLPPYRSLLAQLDVSVLVEVDGDFGIYGPTLWARNRVTPEERYEVAWPGLALVLGQSLPYWPFTLRDPELIAAWEPGATSLTAPATPELDTAALLRMAAMFEPGHPTHRTLLALAQTLQQRCTADAVGDLRIVDERAARIAEYAHRWPGLPDQPIQVAARPLDLDLPSSDLDDLDPTVARIGWGELLQRSDTLSWQCVRQCLLWDGGKFFAFSSPERIDPTTPAGAEWRNRLEPADRKPAVFAQITEPDEEHRPGFRDPLTDAPAVLAADGEILACIPNRLPAHAPLAELILDHGPMVWVRTSDGTLYPAPQDAKLGPNWGYRGTGPSVLARLIDRLLVDINAPAPDGAAITADGPGGLEELARLRWPRGTVLDRAVLEAARDGRPYSHPVPDPDDD